MGGGRRDAACREQGMNGNDQALPTLEGGNGRLLISKKTFQHTL